MFYCESHKVLELSSIQAASWSLVEGNIHEKTNVVDQTKRLPISLEFGAENTN